MTCPGSHICVAKSGFGLGSIFLLKFLIPPPPHRLPPFVAWPHIGREMGPQKTLEGPPTPELVLLAATLVYPPPTAKKRKSPFVLLRWLVADYLALDTACLCHCSRAELNQDRKILIWGKIFLDKYNLLPFCQCFSTNYFVLLAFTAFLLFICSVYL